MKIISISGLDGSGKTTQIEILKNHFETHGRKVYYFHAIEFSIAQKIRRLFSGRKSRKEKSVTTATKTQIRLRKLAFLIDVIRFKFLVAKLKSRDYDFLLTDRFFYDSVVNIAFLMQKNFPPKIEKIMPRTDFAFYLKIDPETIMKRRRIPDQGKIYLQRKKRLYDMYANMWNFRIMDGSESPEKIAKKIISQIRAML